MFVPTSFPGIRYCCALRAATIAKTSPIRGKNAQQNKMKRGQLARQRRQAFTPSVRAFRAQSGRMSALQLQLE